MVEKYNLNQSRRIGDSLRQLRGHLALLGDGVCYLFPALVQISQICKALGNKPDSLVIESAVIFLSVSCDKGNGAAAVQKVYDVVYVFLLYVKFVVKLYVYLQFVTSKSNSRQVKIGSVFLLGRGTFLHKSVKSQLCRHLSHLFIFIGGYAPVYFLVFAAFVKRRVLAHQTEQIAVLRVHFGNGAQYLFGILSVGG